MISQASKVDQEVVKKTNNLGSVLKLLIVLLIVSVLTALSVYGIIFYRLREIRAEHTKLKQELQTLEKSEQRFILLRDRLGKIAKVQTQANTKDEIQISRELVENLQTPTRITDLTITQGSVEAEISTDSSLNITKAFAYLVGSGKYSRVSMLSFDYNPTTAYKVNLQIVK